MPPEAPGSPRAATNRSRGRSLRPSRPSHPSGDPHPGGVTASAVKAQAALDQANSAARRLSSREMLEIASAASAARRAADEKMERYMYLEELISQADA